MWRVGRRAGGGSRQWWLAAAVACAGCTPGATLSGPSSNPAPPPLSSIMGWTGSATYSETLSNVNGDWNLNFTGPVTWQKDENPPADLPVQPGHARYRLASGQMRITYTGTRVVGGSDPYTCADQGVGDVALTPGDPDDPDSYLDVAPDGRYVGSVWHQASVTVVRTCPATGFTGSFSGDVWMRLSIGGTLPESRRMQGAMSPESGGGRTGSGSWDFMPR